MIFFFEHVGMWIKKKPRERKRKWCDAFERAQQANEDDDEENWVKKFVKCFHHQCVWEWANELPSSSSSLFNLIRAHIHRAGILGNEIERKREHKQRHTIILGHDDVDGDFHFRITSEEEQNIRGREKGDGSVKEKLIRSNL